MKTVIFDFDGVGLNSEPVHLKALQHVLSKDGLPVGDAEYYAKYLGLSDFEMAKAILTDKSYKASDQPIEIWKAEKTK